MWVTEKGQDPAFADLVDPQTAALVVIDVQNDFLHQDGAFGRMGRDNSATPAFAERLRGLLAAAREQKIFTVFVRAIYDEYVTPPALAHNRARRGLVNGLCFEGSWGAEWYEGVAPADLPQEVVITKHRFDAFQGTPLDLYLRANGIRSVIVTGTATSGCVESTVRHAFFLDYYVVVARDGVIDSVPRYQAASLEIMEESYAKVVPIGTIVETWRGRNATPTLAWTAKETLPATDDAPQALVVAAAQDRNADLLASVLPRLQALLAKARAERWPIIHLRRQDAPIGNSPRRTRHEKAGSAAFLDGCGPLPGEWVVDCPRDNGFSASRLGLLLRTNGIDHFAIAGGEAFGMIDATARDARDRNLGVSVAEDAVGFVPEDIAARTTWRRLLADAGAKLIEAKAVFASGGNRSA